MSDEVAEHKELALGGHWSYNLYNDPKRLAFVLSRYKFAATLVCKGGRVLELGCGEGIGAPMLSEVSASYTGVDMDVEAIGEARQNWGCDKVQFISDDFIGKIYGKFDAIVSFDVIEHIDSIDEIRFLETTWNNLGEDGLLIVGSPNITASPYASLASQRGHVNLYDGQRLRGAFQKLFHNVFLFGMNDEVVHTGFHSMAHYLIALGCYKRRSIAL